MKNLTINRGIIHAFLITASLLLTVGCNKSDDKDDVTGLKSGLWTGIYNENQDISIIVDENMLIRADLIYQESDYDYNNASKKNMELGPLETGGNTSLVIKEEISIGSNYDVKAEISVNIHFESATKATGQIITKEDDVVISTKDFEINWKQEIPATGYVRDGSWYCSISSPVIVSVSFTTKNGAISSISYLILDSSTLSFGSISKSATVEIGDELNFSIHSSIDVELLFTDYMKGDGDITIQLTTGETTKSADLTWQYALPKNP